MNSNQYFFKTALLLSCIVLYISCSDPIAEPSLMDEWHTYRHHHNKTYNSSEEIARFFIWMQRKLKSKITKALIMFQSINSVIGLIKN